MSADSPDSWPALRADLDRLRAEIEAERDADDGGDYTPADVLEALAGGVVDTLASGPRETRAQDAVALAEAYTRLLALTLTAEPKS